MVSATKKNKATIIKEAIEKAINIQSVAQSIDIQSVAQHIESLRKEKWSNFEIAHYFVTLSDPAQIKSGIAVNILKHIPGLRIAIASYKRTKNMWDEILRFMDSVAGIALTYNPNISNHQGFYAPVTRVLLNLISRSVAKEIPLSETDMGKMLEYLKLNNKGIIKNLASYYGIEIVAGIAKSIPVIGRVFWPGNEKKHSNRKIKFGKDSLVALIDDYEDLKPTPKLDEIKRNPISNEIFEHLNPDKDKWYNNKYILYITSLSVFIFPPSLILLIYGLYKNQSKPVGWYWYLDEHLVYIYSLFLPPIGIYGVRKGKLFNFGPKWYDNRVYCILSQIYLLPLIITSPIALYALIKTSAISIKGKILVGFIFCFYVALICMEEFVYNT